MIFKDRGRGPIWIVRALVTTSLITIATIALGARQTGPSATIIVKKGYDKGVGIGASTIQYYFYSTSDQCKGRKNLSRFTWINGASHTKVVPAGQVLFFSAHTDRLSSGGVSPTYGGTTVQFDTARCTNLIRFTPQADEQYTIMQHAKIGEACMMTVISESTHTEPPDLAILEAPDC